MSIAEKLTQIAENQQRVYDAGFTAGQEQGGGDSHYDTFWDAYQENGNRIDYDRAFGGIGWTAETFKPKYLPIRPTIGSMYMTFAYSDVGKIDESILDTSQMKNLAMSFYQQSADNEQGVYYVEIDVSSLTRMSDTFNYNKPLKTVILKNIPETCDFTGGFTGCEGITDFTVSGTIGGTTLNLQNAYKLTLESAKHIMQHLKNHSGTDKANTCTVRFSTNVWTLLDADGNTAPGNVSWSQYLTDIGWLK